MKSLTLYSTATQNTWRRGLALGNAPDARILRWRYQHFGIFWRYLTLKFAFSPMPTPDASQWNIDCVGSQRKILALAMYISCFLCRFHLRLVPNANPISSGIWALERFLADGLLDLLLYILIEIKNIHRYPCSSVLIGLISLTFPTEMRHKSLNRGVRRYQSRS